MKKDEIQEIIQYVNQKYEQNVPRPLRFIVRKKTKMIEDFDVAEMPQSLRDCSVENYIQIVKDGLKKGTVKF